jgi:hypothetical protein
VGREPRWLTDPLLQTLIELHAEGWAHSIEVWLDGDLIGGAMGIGIGRVISGDSLFSRYPGAGGVAVADMAARLGLAGGLLIDAQWDSPFLRSLGAGSLPRERYLRLLDGSAERTLLPGQRFPARRLLEGGPGSLPAAGAAGLGFVMWWVARCGWGWACCPVTICRFCGFFPHAERIGYRVDGAFVPVLAGPMAHRPAWAGPGGCGAAGDRNRRVPVRAGWGRDPAVLDREP